MSTTIRRGLQRRSGSIVVISDRFDTESRDPPICIVGEGREEPVLGGYLERLPLALIATGRFGRVEIWHHVAHPRAAGILYHDRRLSRRAFHLADWQAPFDNVAMAEHLAAEGAPELLLFYGLGASTRVLDAAAASCIVYNSIDAPAMRVPPEISSRCDLILAGADWQSSEIRQPILTEYMLAGLPVLANAGLTCGLQYILPETGEAAVPDGWPATIDRMLANLDSYSPRQPAIDRWNWPVSVRRFLDVYDRLAKSPINLPYPACAESA